MEHGVYTSTLYGTLSLVSQIKDLNYLNSTYNDVILVWICNSLYWVLNKSFELKINGQITLNADNIDNLTELECVNRILNKFNEIFSKNSRILNDSISQLAKMVQLCKLN